MEFLSLRVGFGNTYDFVELAPKLTLMEFDGIAFGADGIAPCYADLKIKPPKQKKTTLVNGCKNAWRRRLPPSRSSRGSAGGGAGAGAEEERWKIRVRANVNLLSPQSESDRCGLLVNVYPSHDAHGGSSSGVWSSSSSA